MADAAPHAPEEIELKFEIEPAGLLAVRALPCFAEAGPSPKLLTSTYWDTPDHALAAAGLTLRVRRDGERRLQAVKTADGAGLLSRGEWECEIAGDTPDLSAIAQTPLVKVLTHKLAKRLVPQFTTKVRRTQRIVRHGGAAIELSLDEGEVQAGDRSEMLLQLELELKAGPPAALFSFARPLLETAPLRLSFVTKAQAGYALASDGRKPPKTPPPTLSPDQDAAAALQAILRAVLGELSTAVERARRTLEPRTVHATRVAARRLRAALAVAAELGPDPARDGLADEVRWLAGEFNTARDLDVFLAETLSDAEPDSERLVADAALRAALTEARGLAYARAEAALRSERLRRLLFEATAWAAALPHADLPACDFAGRGLDGRWKRVRKRAAALEGDDAHARHRLRIAFKKLRYAVEFLGGLYDDRAHDRERFLRWTRRLQEALGQLNDVAVAPRIVLPVLQGAGDLPVALYAGERIGLRAAEAAGSLKAARRAWGKLEDAGPFW